MFVFVISNFLKSSTVNAASLCTFVRFESMISPSIRFDISLQNSRSFVVEITVVQGLVLFDITSIQFGVLQP